MDDVFEQVADGGQEAAPEVVETPAPEASIEAGETQETPQEPANEPSIEDLRAQLEAVTKERNDFKGQVVGRQRAADREAAWDVRIGGLERTINALLKHRLAEGASDDLGKELESIQQETATATSQRAWERSYGRAADLMNEALADDDGNVVIDKGAPELAKVRERWAAAREANDPEGLLEAVHMANRVRLTVERKAAQAKPAPEPEPAKPPGSGLEMANVSGAPAAGMNDSELVKAYGRGDIGYTPEVQAAMARRKRLTS